MPKVDDGMMILSSESVSYSHSVLSPVSKIK